MLPRCRASSTRLPAHSEAALHSAFPSSAPPSLSLGLSAHCPSRRLQAIKALWPYPALHPRLALLLSNRAAALLSLGKPFQALKDCNMGLKVCARALPALLLCCPGNVFVEALGTLSGWACAPGPLAMQSAQSPSVPGRAGSS